MATGTVQQGNQRRAPVLQENEDDEDQPGTTAANSVMTTSLMAARTNFVAS